jgi:hypothetical protein
MGVAGQRRGLAGRCTEMAESTRTLGGSSGAAKEGSSTSRRVVEGDGHDQEPGIDAKRLCARPRRGAGGTEVPKVEQTSGEAGSGNWCGSLLGCVPAALRKCVEAKNNSVDSSKRSLAATPRRAGKSTWACEHPACRFVLELPLLAALMSAPALPASGLSGGCASFCPAAEERSRPRHSLFETQVMVKAYSRRGAGSAAPSAGTVRTFDALVGATTHVANLLRAFPLDVALSNFVLDRFRAIRQDFILQDCETSRPGRWLESLRVQARVLVILIASGVSDSGKLAWDQLQASISPLVDAGDAEFCSYDALLKIGAGQWGFLNTSRLDLVTLGLVTAAKLGDYYRFFALLERRASPMHKCAAQHATWRMQASALLAWQRSCRVETFAFEYLRRTLHMTHVRESICSLGLASDADSVVLRKSDPPLLLTAADQTGTAQKWQAMHDAEVLRQAVAMALS